jgi:hypothetical protein
MGSSQWGTGLVVGLRLVLESLVMGWSRMAAPRLVMGLNLHPWDLGMGYLSAGLAQRALG